MADKSFTFFEVHLHDGFSISGTNTAPAIGGPDDESEAEASAAIDAAETDEESEYETGDRSFGAGDGAKVLLGLVLVAGLAVAARVLMGGEDLEELEELDDLAAEA
jgi:hypothetical protein